MHLRDDADILAEIRVLNGTASSVPGDDELMRAALPALRADYQAIETYSCAPDVTARCPSSVLTGDSDPKTTLEEAKACVQHTTEAFDLRVFPGGHFFLSDHVDEIIKILDRYIHASG